MKKKLLSISLLGLCGILLTTALFSDEPAKQERVPVGIRSESLEKRKAQLEERSKMAFDSQEETSLNKNPNTTNKLKKSIAKSVYYTSHPGGYQNPVSISLLGDSVELLDGSIWLVDSADAYKAINWYPSDFVVITPNHSWFSSYAFCMTNQNTGESLAVNLNLGPIAPAFGSIYTHWVVGIDYYNNIIYLEDGSYWNMSTFDSGVISQWVIGDVVIIGVNDGWLSSSKPNILINVAMLTFAAGAASF